jgi:hypothetical protein
VEEYSKNQKKHAGIYKYVFTENSPDKMAEKYNKRRFMGAYWTKTIRQTDKEKKMVLDWPHTPETIRNN